MIQTKSIIQHNLFSSLNVISVSEEEACKFESMGKINFYLILYSVLVIYRVIRRRINTKKFFPFTDAESSDSCQTDYSEKRAIPISIPTMHVKNKDGDRYVVRFFYSKQLNIEFLNFYLT